MKKKLKRQVIYLVVAFLAIVAGLTTSSTYLQKKTNEIVYGDPSTKAILKAENAEFETNLNNEGVEYSKIGNAIYIVNYESSIQAEKAVYTDYQNVSDVIANEDLQFFTSGKILKSSAVSNVTKVETLPEGYTLRQYADEQGKKLVAVIDTGVNDYAIQSVNFTDEDEIDNNGHGTNVAKVILDNSDDNALIVSLKALNKDGVGYMSNIMKALEYAREQHIDIINMSIAAQDNNYASIFKQQIQDIISEGIQVVASAGNYNTSTLKYIPANIDTVISVGAINEKNEISNQSNYGAKYYEVANSSSEAAAIVTGKLVNGTPLSSLTSGNDVIFDSNKVESGLVSEYGKVYQSENNGETTGVSYGLNVSDDIKSEVLSSDAQYVISASKDVERYIKNNNPTVYYDGAYNAYHYAFTSETDYDNARKNLENLKDILLYGEQIDRNFTVQAYDKNTNSGWINGRVWDDGTHQGQWLVKLWMSSGNCKVNWEVHIVSNGWVGGNLASGEYINIQVKRGNQTFVNQNAVNFNGIGGDGKSGQQDERNVGSGSFTDYAHNATYTTSVDFRHAGLSGTIGSQVVNLTIDGQYPGYYLDLNFFDPNGGHTDDGKVGTADITINGTKTENAKDSLSYGLFNYSFEVSNIKLNKSLKLDSVSTTGGANKYENTDIDIKTKWTNVNLSLEGGTLDGQTGTVVKTASKINDVINLGTPTRKGYIFSHWEITNNVGTLNGKLYTFGNDDGNVKAVWSQGTFNLTINGNGGSVDNSYEKEYSVTVNESTNNSINKNLFEYPGFTFNGLYTSKEGGTKVYDANGNAVKNTDYWASNGTWKYKGDVTLYAQWNENSYTVKYDANGGTGAIASTTQKYTKSFNLASSGFTKKGYTLSGWNTKKDGTGQGYRLGQNVSKLLKDNNGTITLYAQWGEASYTVTFDGNQGFVPQGSIETVQGTMANQSRVADDGKKLSKNGFTWEGHTFLGWSENPDATRATYKDEDTTTVNFNDEGKVTLYAVWQTNQYTTTIIAGEGTWNGMTSTNRTDNWGTEFSLGQPTPNSKTSYITYTNVDDATIDRTSDTVTWEFKNWSITDSAHGYFDKQYGTRESTSGDFTVQSTNDVITANYYFTSVVLPSPTKEGSNFLGWYKDEALTEKAGNGGDIYRASGTETLYARWEKTTFNYDETIQAFMQDASGDTEGVFIRKVDADTGKPLVSENGSGFIIGIYDGSVADRNLVLKLDTSKGIYDKSGNLLADIYSVDERGYYEITDYLTVGTKYVAHEIEAAPGYLLDVDQEFTFKEKERTSITMKDPEVYPEKDNYRKLDEFGRPVSEATFSLKDETTNTVIGTLSNALKTDKNGNLNSKALMRVCVAGHRYSLTEVDVPEGYEAAPVTYFTMPELASDVIPQILIEEPVKEASKFKIRKVNSDDEPLQGAEFQLFMKDADGNLVPCYMNKDTHEWVYATEASEDVVEMKLTTGEDGYIEFTNLPLRASYTGFEPDYTKSYYLVETKAPEGYSLLAEPVEIRLPDDGNTVFEYTVKDETVTLTLEAGGAGNLIYIAGGFVMIAVTAIALTIKKKAKKA